MGPLWILGCRDGNRLRNAGRPGAVRPEAHVLCRRADRGHLRRPAAATASSSACSATATAVEITDTLDFDIRNSYQVARCIRGRTVNGVPRLGHVVGAIRSPMGRWPPCPPRCRGASGPAPDAACLDSSGPLRARRGVAHAAATCPSRFDDAPDPRSSPSTGVANDGWIDFMRLRQRGAVDRSRRTLRPTRAKRIDDEFKVAYDEPLQATFQFTVEDDRVSRRRCGTWWCRRSTPVIGGMLERQLRLRSRGAGASRRRSRRRVASTCRTTRSASRWSRSRSAATPSAASRAGRARARPTTGAPRSCRWRRRASACASRIEREKGKVAWGELIAIERPGPDRVPPPCPLFGTCGGCQWQHVTIAAQHAAKRAIVERALGVPVPAVVAAGPPFGYRDRAKLAVGPGGTLGFRARRSHDLVDVPALSAVRPGAGARAAGAARDRARAGAPASRSTRRRAATAFTSTSPTPTRPARRTRGARLTVWARPASSGCRWRASRRSGARTSTSPSRGRRRCAFRPTASRRSGAPATRRWSRR